MFFHYASRWVHLTCAAAMMLLAVSPYQFNNPLLLLALLPAAIMWAWLANHAGRRRLIRTATGSARRWRSTRVQGRITPKTAKHISRAVKRAKHHEQPLAVFINSCGGDLVSAREIIERLAAHNSRVIIIALNRCMSAATIITCAYPRYDRFALANCSIMIHTATVYQSKKKEKPPKHLKESQAWFNDLVGDAEHVEAVPTVNDFLAAVIAKDTELDEEFLRMLFATGGDLYFSAENALETGLIGKILEP